MEGVYKAGKALQARVRVGASTKELREARASMASELEMVRDRMATDSWARRNLANSYTAYVKALDAYSFAAEIVEFKAGFDICCQQLSPEDVAVLPSLHEADSLRERKLRQDLRDSMLEGLRLSRTLECMKKYESTVNDLRRRGNLLKVGCKDVDLRPECAFENADNLLRAADVMLYPHRR